MGEDRYKEGRDYEMVDKGGYKTRRFFTKAEKEAMKAPKSEPKAKAKAKAPSKSSAPKTSPRPKAKPKKDAMEGYRPGDVTMGPIDAKGKTYSGRGKSKGGATVKSERLQAKTNAGGEISRRDAYRLAKTLARKAAKGNVGLPEIEEKKKKGYAKGGMVKANCGASMKPTQKGK